MSYWLSPGHLGMETEAQELAETKRTLVFRVRKQGKAVSLTELGGS